MHHERMRADDEVWARLLHAAAAKLEQQKRTVRLAGGLGSGAGILTLTLTLLTLTLTLTLNLTRTSLDPNPNQS